MPLLLALFGATACSSNDDAAPMPADTGGADTSGDTATGDTSVDDAATDSFVADDATSDAASDSTSDAPTDSTSDAGKAGGELAFVAGYGAAGLDAVTAAAFGGSDLYLGGYVTGTTALDPGKAISGSAFLARIDAAGKAKWALSMTSTSYVGPTAITVAKSGHVLALVDFRGTVTLGATDYTSAGGIDILLVDVDPGGTIVAVKQFGGAGDEIGSAIAVDPTTDRVAIGGHYASSGSLGGAALPAPKGGSDAYLLLLDASGKRLASVGFGGPTDDHLDAVAFDPSGNVVAAGKASGTIDFGAGGKITSAGGSDACVVRMDPTGAITRSKCWGSAAEEWASSIAIDAAGKVWIGGGFSGPVDFGGGLLTPDGSDGFVLGLDAAWSYSAAYQYGGAGYDEIVRVGFGPGGDLLLAGNFTTAVTFDGTVKSGKGKTDVFAARITAGGVAKWAVTYGDTNDEYLYGAATDPLAGVALYGTYETSTTFGSSTLTSVGGNDAFYARVTP